MSHTSTSWRTGGRVLELGDIFIIPVAEGAFAVGWLVWTHPEGAYQYALVDQYWDHEPSTAEVRQGRLRLVGDPGFPLRIGVDGGFTYRVLFNDPDFPPESANRVGAHYCRRAEQAHSLILPYWRSRCDRASWQAERRAVVRAAGLEWRPPAGLAGWRNALPVEELKGTFADHWALHRVLSGAIERLQRVGPKDVDAVFRDAVEQIDAYHRTVQPLDEDAGELMVRRLIQVGHCAGISPDRIQQLTAHRAWPAGPLQSLNLPATGALPTDRWPTRRAAEPERYTHDAIQAVEAALKSAQKTRTQLPPKAKRDDWLAWVRDVVLAINAADGEHGVIDTEEREELVRWILGQVPVKLAGDPTERWREW